MKHLRRVLALLSLAAMVVVFVAPGAAAAYRLGWIARVQLVPAVLAGSVAVVLALAASVALFGRLYCALVCPLGLAQDLVRALARLCRVPAVRLGGGRALLALRLVLLALFVGGCFLGFTGLVEPYGVFGRFLTAGVLRLGEPSVAVVAWAVGLFAGIVLVGAVVPRAWCNAVCPVGTLLGLFARFALLRVRIDAAKCVNCNACAKACEKGCIPFGPGKRVDATRCVACLACRGTCRKGALRFTP